MKITIETLLNTPTNVESLERVGGGGEGEVYRLPASPHLGKLYRSDMLNRDRQEKVLDLCSRFDTFHSLFSTYKFAFPEKAALDEAKEIVGFAMPEIANSPQLDKLFYQNGDFQEWYGHKLDIKSAIKLAYDLFEAIGQLHKARIIIGDLNPSNILYDFGSGKPAFIDLDSAQIGRFSCAVVGNDDMYLDPLVEKKGVNTSSCFSFTQESDYFALAIIICELIVGGNPYVYRAVPANPDDSAIRRRNHWPLLGFVEDPDFASKCGIDKWDFRINKDRLERFAALQDADSRLYKYLADTLLHGKRENLLSMLPRSDKRHPEYAMRQGIKNIADVRAKSPRKGEIKFTKQTSLFTEEDKFMIANILNSTPGRLRALNTEDPKAFKMFATNLGLGYLLQTGGKN